MVSTFEFETGVKGIVPDVEEKPSAAFFLALTMVLRKVQR